MEEKIKKGSREYLTKVTEKEQRKGKQMGQRRKKDKTGEMKENQQKRKWERK